MALLTIENLFAYYGMAESLHGVSLEVEEGAIVGIIGPNGAGKSTLMDSIMGLTETKGSIRLAGKELRKLPPATIVDLGVGYAPERAHLFPYMSVRDNLLVGAYTARADIAPQSRPRARPVSGAEGALGAGNCDAERRRATDGVAGPRPDDQPQGAARR